MKKVLYFAVVLIIALCVYFVPDWEGEDVSDGVVLEEAEGLEQAAIETIEEKAYRVETTPVAAPEDYDSLSREIWNIEETLRVAQAKIRISSGNDADKFIKKWRGFRRENQEIYRRKRELTRKKQMDTFSKAISAKHGIDSPQYKRYQFLVRQVEAKEIPLKSFYQQIRNIK